MESIEGFGIEGNKMRTVKLSFLGAVGILIICLSSVRGAIFSDDFASGYSQWTLDKSGYADFSIENQEAKFTVKSQHVYLKSKVINSSNWNTVDFNGQWRMTAHSTPEYDIFVYDANDEANYIRVTYQSWGGPNLWLRDSAKGTLYQASRTPPSTMTDFSINLTQTGWSFTEGSSSWGEYSSTTLASATGFRIKIGGWDCSNGANQIVYFDNIEVVPEPATIGFLLVGGLALPFLRKKH